MGESVSLEGGGHLLQGVLGQQDNRSCNLAQVDARGKARGTHEAEGSFGEREPIGRLDGQSSLEAGVIRCRRALAISIARATRNLVRSLRRGPSSDELHSLAVARLRKYARDDRGLGSLLRLGTWSLGQFSLPFRAFLLKHCDICGWRAK